MAPIGLKAVVGESKWSRGPIAGGGCSGPGGAGRSTCPRRPASALAARPARPGLPAGGPFIPAPPSTEGSPPGGCGRRPRLLFPSSPPFPHSAPTPPLLTHPTWFSSSLPSSPSPFPSIPRAPSLHLSPSPHLPLFTPFSLLPPGPLHPAFGPCSPSPSISRSRYLPCISPRPFLAFFIP